MNSHPSIAAIVEQIHWRIEYRLRTEPDPFARPSEALRELAKIAVWVEREAGLSPAWVVLCETCEDDDEDAYHVARNGLCRNCGGHGHITDMSLAAIAAAYQPEEE